MILDVRWRDKSEEYPDVDQWYFKEGTDVVVMVCGDQMIMVRDWVEIVVRDWVEILVTEGEATP